MTEAIDVVDVGVDSSNLGIGAGVGLGLMICTVVLARSNKPLAMLLLGLTLGLYGGYLLLRAYICLHRSHDEPVSIEKVWIEMYRRPGYTGVVPRYRVKVSARDANGYELQSLRVFPFMPDNAFEELGEARDVAEQVRQVKARLACAMGGTFLLRRVSSGRVVNAAALTAVGGLFLCIACLLFPA